MCINAHAGVKSLLSTDGSVEASKKRVGGCLEADHLIHCWNADRNLLDSLLTLHSLRRSSLKGSLVSRDPYDFLDKGS